MSTTDADRPQSPRDDAALASSTPDDSSTLLRMLKRVEILQPQWLAALIIGTAVMFWTVVRFGGDLAIKVFPMVSELIRYDAQGKAEQSAAILGSLNKIDGKVDGISQRVERIEGKQAAQDAAAAAQARQIRTLSAEQARAKAAVQER